MPDTTPPTPDTIPVHPYQMTIDLNVLNHLGIGLYSNVPAVISEAVANAYDADAQRVTIDFNATTGTITIEDNGRGMTRDDVNHRFLKIGYRKRDDQEAPKSAFYREPMGRKGIGKLALFSIADTIEVRTAKAAEGDELLQAGFILSAQAIKAKIEADVKSGLPPIYYPEPIAQDQLTRTQHGTRLVLTNLKRSITRAITTESLRKRLARRFSVIGAAQNFEVVLNGDPISVSDRNYLPKLQYIWYFGDEGEKAAGLATTAQKKVEMSGVIDSKLGWNIEGWVGTFEKQENFEEGENSITILARGKLVHEDILKDMKEGGVYTKYLIGEISADFLDDDAEDDIATSDRQSLSENDIRYISMKKFIQDQLLKPAGTRWTNFRNEKKQDLLQDALGPYYQRLDKLPPHERKTVTIALQKLADIPTLEEDRFEAVCNAVLTAWESGRLRGLIADIANADRLSDEGFLSLLGEANVLTALNIAETVRTKLSVITGLKERIEKKELELAVRDYIAKNPWLIAPEWETYRIENSLVKVIKDATAAAKLDTIDGYKGRVDLVLSSGEDLLVLEFMRPGLTVDFDHLTRFESYVRHIRNHVKVLTGGSFRSVSRGYIIADKLDKDGVTRDKVESLSRDAMLAMDWEEMLAKAGRQWRDVLDTQISRSPKDDRLRSLAPPISNPSIGTPSTSAAVDDDDETPGDDEDFNSPQDSDA